MLDISVAGWPVAMSGISAFFTAAALGILIHAIVKKRSKPYLFAWGIRILLVVVAFLSQLAAGATYSLAMSGTQVVGGVLIIGLILVRQPRVGRFTGRDGLAIGAAGIGVMVWMLSGNPLHGLLGTMLADTAATALGIHATLNYGARESLSFWVCALVAASAAALATAGAGAINPVVLLAPLFSCGNAVANIVACWYVRHRSFKRAATKQPTIIPETDSL